MRNNYQLSENLEKKIKQKCQKIISAEFTEKTTPKNSISKSTTTVVNDGWSIINEPNPSFRDTIENPKNTINENFSLTIPVDQQKTHLKYRFLTKNSMVAENNEQLNLSVVDTEDEMGSFDVRKVDTANLVMDDVDL
jgi:hypothetical protein